MLLALVIEHMTKWQKMAIVNSPPIQTTRRNVTKDPINGQKCIGSRNHYISFATRLGKDQREREKLHTYKSQTLSCCFFPHLLNL